MENKIKNWLLYFIYIVLFMPITNQYFKYIKTDGLKGSFKVATDSSFSIRRWIGGTYQSQKEAYLNDATGFRADMVRLTNQIDYSFFDICHTGWTLKGKDGYLFQYPYIDAYYGNDYVGYQTIYEKSKKLKAIQDTLKRLGKSLILVYCPSKATSYPEYFPENRITKKGTTNYSTYRRVCDSLGVNQVDFDAWFLSMKNNSKEPLFSKQGIHFTSYGSIIAGDSLIRRIESLQNIKVKHPTWTEVEHTTKLRLGDDDIASELNLIFPVAKETMAYPIIINKPNDSERVINAIYIGDSYCHKMVEFGVMYMMNSQCEFWSQFEELHDINGHKWSWIKDYNWKSALDKTDCVVLAYTLFNFYKLGGGFIEQAYDYYYPNGAKP